MWQQGTWDICDRARFDNTQMSACLMLFTLCLWVFKFVAGCNTSETLDTRGSMTWASGPTPFRGTHLLPPLRCSPNFCISDRTLANSNSYKVWWPRPSLLRGLCSEFVLFRPCCHGDHLLFLLGLEIPYVKHLHSRHIHFCFCCPATTWYSMIIRINDPCI